MKYKNIREEELKNKIGVDWFKAFDTTEILGNIDFTVFQEQFTKKKNLNKVIGIVLMDQKTISGIGNYLRADILWLSKISPFRKVNKLSDQEFKLIYHNTKVLTWGDYDKKYAIKHKIID